MATASHELRTPVTVVATFAGLLQEDAAGLPEEPREFAGIIEGRNANRLLRLVDELLLLGRLESGQLPVQPGLVDLATHVDAAVVSIRPLAEDGRVDGHDDGARRSPAEEPIPSASTRSSPTSSPMP